MRTGRTPRQVIIDAIYAEDDRGEERPPADYPRAVEEALRDEGWLRTPAERLASAAPRRTYSLSEIRDGTGFAPGTRFVPTS